MCVPLEIPVWRVDFPGAQLCAIYDTPLAGAPFDAAMDALIGLQGDEVELTLFRGTQEELREFIGG